MKIRKLPFGYKIEGGRPLVLPKEAEIVTMIFQQYAAGYSCMDLAETLKNQPVSYDTARAWNKTMVARILNNRRYLGQMEYPAIIDEELFLQTSQRRDAKQLTKLTEPQKVLRRLSGQRVSRDAENAVKALLNALIERPDSIQQSADPIGNSGKIGKLEANLEMLLDSQPIDENAAQRLIRQIAAVQYEAIPSAEYETQRLRHIFAQAEPMEELDIGLLKCTVSQIKIDGNGAVSIRLKNDQIIERSILPCPTPM